MKIRILHTSHETEKWRKGNGWDVVTGPPKSPDMSIMETWTKSLKGSFYGRHSGSETPGPKRIEIIFEKLDQDNDGSTLLLWAAKNGQEATVKLLLDQNATVDSQDKYG